MRMNSLLVHFCFSSVKQVHFLGPALAGRPPCKGIRAHSRSGNSAFCLPLAQGQTPSYKFGLSVLLSFSSSFSVFGTNGMMLLQIYVCCASYFWQVTSVLYLNISVNFMCQLDSAMRCQAIWSNII